MLAVVFLFTIIIAEKVIQSFKVIYSILFVKLSETKFSIYVTQKNF